MKVSDRGDTGSIFQLTTVKAFPPCTNALAPMGEAAARCWGQRSASHGAGEGLDLGLEQDDFSLCSAFPLGEVEKLANN